MLAHGLTPILNVSSMQESFDWFASRRMAGARA